jgi:hypothetical protein
MRAATQERLIKAQRAIAAGDIVFIRLASSGREHRVFAIAATSHNIEATLDEDDQQWMTVDPEEFVGIRVVEVPYV